MSLWHIAWSYLWNRKLTTVLTILSVGLAVGLISSVLTLRAETQKRFEEEGQAFDMVVGAGSGSPLQLVLSSVYFMDNPIGNVSYKAYEALKADTEYVTGAYPIGMGDSYRGFRIVGTTRSLMNHAWEHPITGAKKSPFVLADGEYFSKPMEAVVGYAAAMNAGLKVGSTFVGNHGMIELPEQLRRAAHDHSDMPYTVVGILEPSNSPFDRAIYCTLDSVWQAHGDHAHEEGEEGHDDHAHDDHAHDDHDHAHDHAHHDHGHDHHDHDHEHTEDCDHEAAAVDNFKAAPDAEVTAVLLQFDSPAYRLQYRERMEELGNFNWQGAVPIDEIAKLFEKFLQPAKAMMMAVGYLVVVISALSILIGLYLSILQRKRDLAIMRALGASSYEIFGAVIIEAFLVTVLGIISGWFIGQTITAMVGVVLAREYGLVITPFGITFEEINAFCTVGLVGLLAGILPAWQAYNTDVAHDLADR